MSQNHSKQSSSSQLAEHYRNANGSVFGTFPFVRKEHYPKFLVMEDDLREDGISCKDYAYTVINIFRKWTIDKGMNYVPINVFLGKVAYNKFLKVYQSESVIIPTNDDKDKMLYSELLVARAYIHLNTENGNVVRLKDVVSDMKGLLYEDWLSAYDCGKGRPTSEALDILSLEYRVRNATNYVDIVTAINNAR